MTILIANAEPSSASDAGTALYTQQAFALRVQDAHAAPHRPRTVSGGVPGKFTQHMRWANDNNYVGDRHSVRHDRIPREAGTRRACRASAIMGARVTKPRYIGIVTLPVLLQAGTGELWSV